MFSQKDIEQIKAKGITQAEVEKQMQSFVLGFDFINLIAPATVPDGIKRFSEKEAINMALTFDSIMKQYKVIKFVPASGAATRMFKNLYSFRENYKGSEKDYQSFIADKSIDSVYQFIVQIKKFAFYHDLKAVMAMHGKDIEECIINKDFITIIDYVLDEKGLGYGLLPKALIQFHPYPDAAHTAMEEHLIEGAIYACSKEKKVEIHFTISQEHVDIFLNKVNNVKTKYENIYGVKYQITYSVQKSSTDTIAADENNEMFREKDGRLYFRPGGHGALIENLNDLNGDYFFIKNIDNVVPDHLREPTYLYKKVIGTYLHNIKTRVFEYLNKLEQSPTIELINEIALFAKEELFIKIPVEFDKNTLEEKRLFLFKKLNRPIRICGMVKNDGDTGGGPFWVENNMGELSLQIAETSQINLTDENQKNIFHSATHFNPVDIACCIKDYKGNPFDLKKFIDTKAGFISIKSKDGKTLKALELPGLWNGSMSDWISVFVETPLITFNPVKTINDLLKDEHQ